MYWDDKPYYSLNYHLKNTYGHKIYKLSLDGGMTCPNRDGTLGKRGCIFCSEGGSGDFAVRRQSDISKQLSLAKQKIADKTNACDFIAYYQSYTNTYAPVSYLKNLYEQAITQDDIKILSIATRPDCIPDEVIALLTDLKKKKEIWIELGLQTIHPDTAALIRRGYPLSVFEDTVYKLKKAGITVIVHVILGLPYETHEMMLQTIDYLAKLPIDGIKLQLLHVLKGTDLADLYLSKPFHILTMDEYIDLVIDCVERLPQNIVIHRITGDGPKNLLVAPLWSGNKKVVLNTIHKRFKERNTWQGKFFSS